MVSVVDVLFSLGRICLGYYCLLCVVGGCLGLGRPAGVFAWVLCRCMVSSRYFVGYGGLLGSLVRHFFFLLFCYAFFTTSCSSSIVPPALYVLLCGSGSSLLRGSVMPVIRLPIHGVISPMRTYRRCILDNWSTWR